MSVAEYNILINERFRGERVILRGHPQLRITYVHAKNSLCPSNYSQAVCIREGDLRVTLSIDGQEVTLSDHDRLRGEVSSVEVGGEKYLFQGLRPLIRDRSREQTYLVFSVSRPESEPPPFYQSARRN